VYSRRAAGKRNPPRVGALSIAGRVRLDGQGDQQGRIHASLVASGSDGWMFALREQRAAAIVDWLELDRRPFVFAVAAAGPHDEALHGAQMQRGPRHSSGGYEHERQKPCRCSQHTKQV